MKENRDIKDRRVTNRLYQLIRITCLFYKLVRPKELLKNKNGKRRKRKQNKNKMLHHFLIIYRIRSAYCSKGIMKRMKL